MAKDMERTCKNCGNTWLVPKRAAYEQAPNRLEMVGRKMMAGGSSMSPLSFRRTSDQLRLANAQAKLNRVLANSQCPVCGSSRYKQGKPSRRRTAPVPAPVPSPRQPAAQRPHATTWAAIDALLDELQADGWKMRARTLRKEIAWLREEAAKRGHNLDV